MANVYGTKGNDLIDGSDGVTNGADQIYGYEGHDTIYGFGGADTIFGHDGNDIILAGSGSDTLKGGGGADDLDGGFGTDEANYSDSLSAVTVSLMSGTGTGGTAEGDTLTSIENVIGTGFADTLWGNDSVNVLHGCGGTDSLKGFGENDTLWGGAGHDFLFGMDGDDTIDGGPGSDTMSGGIGNDTYYVDNSHDVVTESGGQGLDEVITSVSWVLNASADVEILRTSNDSGLAAIDLFGNSSGNIVRGNNGNNLLNGGDGNDELTGLAGQDSFMFDRPLSAAFNVDVITDFNVADDTILLSDNVFSNSLELGSVAGSQFVIGTAALDAGDRIIYNSATGALLYDSDGTGATAAIQFAEVSAGLSLTNFDFFVVPGFGLDI
jgi:serralysin